MPRHPAERVEGGFDYGGTRQHISAPGQVHGQTEVEEYRPAIFITFKRNLQFLGRNPRLLLSRRAVGEEEIVFSRPLADCQTGSKSSCRLVPMPQSMRPTWSTILGTLVRRNPGFSTGSGIDGRTGSGSTRAGRWRFAWRR
jgi:hypothetical protein